MFLRMKMKLLWLSHAWKFIWAHKPLCSHFSRDVLKLGSIYLCRSCLFAWLGIIIGTVSLLFSTPFWQSRADLLLSGALLVTIPLSFPPVYKKLPRFLRDILRLLMGLVLPLTIFTLVNVDLRVGITAAATIFLFWYFYFKVRKQRKLHQCDHCSELKAGGVCSGFTRQACAVRKYEERATAMLMASGYTPRIK